MAKNQANLGLDTGRGNYTPPVKDSIFAGAAADSSLGMIPSSLKPAGNVVANGEPAQQKRSGTQSRLTTVNRAATNRFPKRNAKN